MWWDGWPDIMIPAVDMFRKKNPSVSVVVYWNSDAIHKIIRPKKWFLSRLWNQRFDTLDLVETNHDIVDEKSEGWDLNPMRLISGNGQKSSIVQWVKAVKSNDIDWFLTRWNSWALALTSMRELWEKGKSGALSVWVPRRWAKDVFMLDVWAYPDAQLEHILRNAELGISHLQWLWIEEPKIWLLNVWTEEYKWKKDYRNAHRSLHEKYWDSFLWNFEPWDVFNRSDADLIVVWWHEWNIWLKTAEATGVLYSDVIKNTLFPTFLQKITRLRAWLLLKKNFWHYSPDNRPDGTMLWIDGTIVKVHGSAWIIPSAIWMQRMTQDISVSRKEEA